MTTTTYEIDASHARVSTCMPDDSRAVDVDVDIMVDGEIVASGEVTLLPAEDGRAVLEPWGDRDNWCSANLLRYVDTLDDGEGRDILDRIAGEAGALARRL